MKEDKNDDIKELKAHVKTIWNGGLKTTGFIRGFEVETDAPRWKYGTNSAPAPGEVFLASIGACFTSTFTRAAQESGVILDDVITDMRGVIDHDEDYKERFTKIMMELKSHADEKYKGELQECFEKSKYRCPLANILNCNMEISYKFIKKKK
jgi:uncharacterized OsmC-like protein